ncbi:MAG TPA: type III pantothenate kinase, partial [Chondromyces sp.]|nr:type III pantothenate kinase [Chondromyces sp.]
MKLCLDVGNSQIYGGLFSGDRLEVRFRKLTPRGASSDELGIFFRQVVRENGHDPADISGIGFCSVVPDINHSLVNACR